MSNVIAELPFHAEAAESAQRPQRTSLSKGALRRAPLNPRSLRGSESRSARGCGCCSFFVLCGLCGTSAASAWKSLALLDAEDGDELGQVFGLLGEVGGGFRHLLHRGEVVAGDLRAVLHRPHHQLPAPLL